MIKLLLLLVSICVVQSIPLNIHVVPHTHDDVGWLKTPDEYFYGANSSIQNAGVQYIIDTVVMALQANPARKFIYVEMAFFYRWWREQSAATQAIVKGLVSSGQLEFINGGWTMHDEACVHFEDMVDQMTLGHQFLKSTFNIVPKIGWQLDPFGHSSTNAIIDALTGFEALFFARMDYQDYTAREQVKALELTWNPSASLKNISILTGMMYGGYCSPGGGFMFEYGDPPIQDDPLLEDYNLVERAQVLMGYANKQASVLRHNDVMLSWGCDFMYQNAHLMYKNIEKLMTYINNNQATYNARLFYSTPSMYAEAIKTANPTLPTKTDDFMPYADNAHSYWSGYFVSRSTLKGFVRYSSHILHAITSLFSTSQISSASLFTQLFAVQAPNGVTTHHDAVTGTEKQHVADDYAKNLNIANTNAFSMFNQIYGGLIAAKSPPTFTFCPLLNQSICPATSISPSGVIPVVIYNPLSWPNTDYVRLPITVSSVKVTDSNNNAVSAQILQGSGAGSYEVVFAATVPALGFTTYFVALGASSEATELSSLMDPNAGITLVNKYLTVNLDSNGNLQSVTVAATGQTVPVQQAYQYYISDPGDQTSKQASGAYIFRPATQTSYPFSTVTPQITISNGSIVSEVRRYFQPDLSQIIRLYASQSYIEIVDVIGPIDVSDGKGKEVITRYTTSFNTMNTWYTDSNGIELIQRKLNYRPTWNFTVEEPVAGNFVPVNAITAITDPAKKLQLTVVVDRSRSGASLSNGELETMLHRRCLVDDSRGVAEPLNETTIMASTEWLVISNTTSAASIYRPLAKKAYHPFVLAFGPSTPFATWKSMYKTDYSPLGITVPPNVHILNFVPLGPAQYILRLHHIYQVGEDSVLSQPVTLDIASLLTGYPIVSIQETQLTAVAASLREDAVKMESDAAIAPINIVLNPTEIRTFLISTKPAVSLSQSSPPSSVHIN